MQAHPSRAFPTLNAGLLYGIGRIQGTICEVSEKETPHEASIIVPVDFWNAHFCFLHQVQ